MKKAQSEVITTVLIILLVLAAVFIVYTAVRSMVTDTTKTASSKATCVGIEFEVTKADATSDSVSVTRKAGGPDGAVTVKILVNGAIKESTKTTTLSQLSSETYPITGGLTAEQKVKVAAVLADGKTGCDASSNEFSVTAS